MNIRDLATIIGVSKSTVAYALKNDPRICQATRIMVQEMAKIHGYRASPVVNRFMNEVRGGRLKNRSINMAYIAGGSELIARKRGLHERLLIEGAKSKAKQLGYHLDIISWEAEQLTEGRLNQVLKTRGIRGILIGPANSTHASMKLNWDEFYSLASGYTLEDPQLDRIAANLYQSSFDVVDKAFGRGYPKVVLAVNTVSDQRVGHRWLSGTLVQQWIYGKGRVQILFGDWNSPCKRLLGAIAKSRGSAIVGHDIVYRALMEYGYRIPGDFGFVALDSCPDTNFISAVQQPHRGLGEKAVERIASMIERDVTGLPMAPLRLTVDCGWHEGSTLPSITC
ncbi:LacI family DNA-binding transcriptional regulator [Cerasicoccus fimbriatus]|uniref:LacI family DNA-binding transcriptional regulator n=1 Tax=Cerasicoccus fimbriatus TaxID=3014554 RepID=UPI0022B38536|nr:LacI family DNA-binding transcriptional regulator [Cerasicoccus sp. TK19100]